MFVLTDVGNVGLDRRWEEVLAVGPQRDGFKVTTAIFRVQIIYVVPATYVIQLTRPTEKLDSFVTALGDAEIMEVVRSGVAGMARGEKVLAP